MSGVEDVRKAGVKQVGCSWDFDLIWNQNLQEIKGYYTRFLQLIVGNIRYLSIYINWLIVFLG